MFNFLFGTEKIGSDEIWTTSIDAPNFIRTKFIRAVPKIVRSVNGPVVNMCW